MKKIIVFSLLAAILWPGAAAAGEKSRIELTDGSSITGEVMEMREGSYRIKSDSLGEIRIPSSRVRSIVSGTSASHSSGKPSQGILSAVPDNPQIESIQKEIASDPKMVELIQTLMSDPELMNTLNDPVMIDKINRGDTASLENDKGFQKIMANPKVREIVRHFQNRH